MRSRRHEVRAAGFPRSRTARRALMLRKTWAFLCGCSTMKNSPIAGDHGAPPPEQPWVDAAWEAVVVPAFDDAAPATAHRRRAPSAASGAAGGFALGFPRRGGETTSPTSPRPSQGLRAVAHGRRSSPGQRQSPVSYGEAARWLDSGEAGRWRRCRARSPDWWGFREHALPAGAEEEGQAQRSARGWTGDGREPRFSLALVAAQALSAVTGRGTRATGGHSARASIART